MTQSNNRRSFLKTSAAIGTAAAVPYHLTTASAQEKLSANDRMKIGVIGAGGMAQGNMRSAKQWLDVVAIADVDRGRSDNANQNMSAGNQLSVTIDGGSVGSFSSAGFAHATKRMLRLAVPRQAVVDGLKIFAL